MVALVLVTAAAYGFWTPTSVPGGNGAALATSVNQASSPSAVVTGRSVSVSWSPSTMANGDAVSGYTIQRYDAATLTLQTTGAGCVGTLTTTSCTETRVPAGTWVYSVIPRFAANWRGPESARSTSVTVTAPRLTLAATTVKAGSSLSGSADGFLAGDTLSYRLGSATGATLTGTLAGSPTPAAVPAGGSGAVTVTVPAGTPDGTHTIYAVTSGGDVATAEVVVDNTAPPAPVFTVTPAAVSGDAVTFAWTEAESGTLLECRLDGATFAACDSPGDLAGLAAGSHTFQVRASDAVGNVSASASYTWTVNLSVPTISISFPAVAGLANDAGFNAGCATPSAGDVCGVADDDQAVTGVAVSLRRASTGLWWNGSSFSATSENFLAATGTTDWSYAIASGSLPEGDYTLRARASDGSNVGYDSRTFTIDRTAPPTPTLTSGPPATSAATATFEFTDADATAGFECRLDGAAYAACSSPQTYTALTTGSHTVTIRAVDGAGNASAAVATTWTVDATAPTASMTFPTATTYNLAGWQAGCGTAAIGDLCGTAGDSGGSGLGTVAVSIRRVSTDSYWDGAAFASSAETWLTATGTTSWTYLFAGTSFPGDGSYVVRHTVTDGVGNSSTGSTTLTIDTTAPPAPTLDRTPTSPSGPSVTFNFSDTDATASFQCRVDGASYAACSSPKAYAALTDGSHTLSVRAIDPAGNIGDPATYTWSVDTSVPVVDITSPDLGAYLTTSTYAAGCGSPAEDICGTAADPGGAVAAVALSIRKASTGLYWDGSEFSSSSEVFLAATGTTSWSYAMSAANLPDDGYTLTARVTDNTGLTFTDSVSVTFDRVAPAAPTITSGPSGTTRGNDSFAWTGESAATFQCRLDAGTYATCVSPTSLGTLPDGSHTYDVRAVDRAGNTGPAVSRTWTVDATGPAIAITFPSAGARLGNTTYNAGCGTATTGDMCGTASDAASTVSTVEINVQQAGTGLYWGGTSFNAASPVWTAATGTTSWTAAFANTRFVANDTYLLTVRATDSVGNASTSSRSFVIDKTKPTGVGVTTTNAVGGTARKLELRDTFTLTYSEAMDPAKILAGWTGATTANVVVRATNNSTADRLTVYNATNTALVPLGTIVLNRTDYVTTGMTFGLTGTPSTMTMSGNGTGITITLGTASSSTANTTAAAAANLKWTPSSTATDLAGNLCATTAYTETDNDDDF